MPIYELDDTLQFPHPNMADNDGLLAIGGDLSLQRLVNAYSTGIFVWPIEHYPWLWFSPPRRAVMRPGEMKVSKSLNTLIRKQKFEIRIDRDFRSVIQHCAQVERNYGVSGTWILPEMVNAYCDLHQIGLAHSIEAYYEQKLVGGLYGASLGGMFFGESMFHTVTDASKVAFFYLNRLLQYLGFDLIDAQVQNPHLQSLGAYEIDREQYLVLLKQALTKETLQGSWQMYEQNII